MVDASELSEGDNVTITGRAAQGDSQTATVIDSGDITVRTLDAGPRVTGTDYSDVALVKIEDDRYAVVNLRNVETVQ